MKKIVSTLFTANLLMAAAVPALAHGDEDHGAKAPIPVRQGQPFAEAHSPDFELALSLSGSQVLLYLDRYADNSPVDGAQIDMEYGGQTLTFKPLGPGEYTASAAALAKPGSHALGFTVIAGDTSDLLETTLVVASAVSAGGEQAPGKIYWLAGAAGALLLGAAAWLFRRRLAGNAVGVCA